MIYYPRRSVNIVGGEVDQGESGNSLDPWFVQTSNPYDDSLVRAMLANIYGRQADGNQKTQVTNFPASQTVNGTVSVSNAFNLEVTQLLVKAATEASALVLGLQNDASVVGNNNGTISAKLRGILVDLDSVISELGAINEPAPASDTASSGLNGRLQRIAQRLTSIISLIPASIGQKVNATSFAVSLSTEQQTILSSIQTAVELIDNAVETNRFAVNPIPGQVGVAAGSGAVSANTQRFTLTTDQESILTAIRTAVQLIDDSVETNRLAVNLIAGQTSIDANAGNPTAKTVRMVRATGANSSVTSVASSITNVTLKASNSARIKVVITNDGLSTLFVKEGTTATATDWTYKLGSGDVVIIDDYSGIIDGIWSAALGSARVTETT